MSGRGKYKSMGVSYREGQDEGSTGRGRGRGRVNKYRKTLNGNYIKQGDTAGSSEDMKPQVTTVGANASHNSSTLTMARPASWQVI